MRGGTTNVPGIVGMGEAAQLAAENMETAMAKVAAVRDHLIARIEAQLRRAALQRGPQDLLELDGLELDLLRRVYLEGYSYEELAQELGVKPNTLASRVSRIKAKFRKNFPDSEHFLQDGCKESRPPGHKEGRGGSEP